MGKEGYRLCQETLSHYTIDSEKNQKMKNEIVM